MGKGIENFKQKRLRTLASFSQMYEALWSTMDMRAVSDDHGA